MTPFRPSSILHLPISEHFPQAVQDSIFMSAKETISACTPFSRITFAHSSMSCAVFPSSFGLPLINRTFDMCFSRDRVRQSARAMHRSGA